jgi:hypothetical protein
MKKVLLIFTLCFLASVVAGCAGKMVFEKNKKLYQIKDDGNDLAGPILASPVPTPAEGDKYGYPDVNHNGTKVAFVLNTGGSENGNLWSMKIDGTQARAILPFGSNISKPRWYPDESFIAYFNAAQGIFKVNPNLAPAAGLPICTPNLQDYGGFDINKPLNGSLQLIISHHETAPSSYKLYRLNTVACTRTSISSVPNQLGVPESEIDETLPVVSIAQDILVNAVTWGSSIGIRMRNISETGDIGPFPLTMRLQGYAFSRITGLSMAGDSNAIYLSASAGTADSRIYVISAAEYIRILKAMITSPPSIPPPIVSVTPRQLVTGSGDSKWPSGRHEP